MKKIKSVIFMLLLLPGISAASRLTCRGLRRVILTAVPAAVLFNE